MPEHLQLAAKMMRPDASLHADQTRWQVGEPRFDLPARPLLPQHNCSALIVAHDVKRVLADIDADYGDSRIELVGHGALLVFGTPCQLGLLAGPEHGRTIPLADMRLVEIPQRSRSPAVSLSVLCCGRAGSTSSRLRTDSCATIPVDGGNDNASTKCGQVERASR